MKRATLLIAMLLMAFTMAMAQTEKIHHHSHDSDEDMVQHRNCGTMIVHQRLLETDPNYRRNFEAMEAQTQLLVKNRMSMAPTENVRTIRVIVHVVWKAAAENISDAQINSQIRILNEDFSRTNIDTSSTPSVFKPLAANTRIQFVLDRVIRKQTTVTSWSTDDKVKYTAQGGSDVVQPSNYLNIWVCNLGGGVLGYAQFPGGPSATDGVVIGYKYFGNTGTATAPFNKGRTATHEVGHYLNLRHIWGDDGTACTGSDFVDDTPNQGGENYGCPTFPKVSCNNGPNGDMFMNYMDYTDDACMNMFSNGQSLRMNAVLDGTRNGLVNWNTTPTITVTAPNGGENWTVGSSRNITWTFTGSISNVRIEYSTNSGTNWIVVTNSTSNSGTYAWTVPNTVSTTCRVRVSDAANANTNDISNANFTISSAPVTVTLLSEGFETNAVPGTFWLAADQNTSSGSDYWGRKATSSGGKAKSGSFAAWCAHNGMTGTAYDNNMNAFMEYKNGLNISGYTNVQISFWIWYKTENSYDYCSFQYWNGSSWVEFSGGRFTGTGTGSGTWTQKTYAVPSAAGTTFRFRWVFYSDGSITNEGAYIDDIVVTGVSALRINKEMAEVPTQFDMHQNYPNPFNPSTTIRFDLPTQTHVRLNIYNTNGQLVRSLVSANYNAGIHEITWDGRNNAGQTVATGLYIYRIQAGNHVKSMKMMLMK